MHQPSKLLVRVLLGGLLAAAAAGQKVPDVRLNTDPAGAADSMAPRIAASGSSVYAVWVDNRNLRNVERGDIFFNRSLDAGATWLASDVRINTNPAGASTSRNPEIATVGSSVYVTWDDSRNGQGDIYFNYSIDGGATWQSSDVRLDTDAPGSGTSSAPQISASGSSVYVAWVEGRGGRANVAFNRSLDGGATWLTADKQINTNPIGSVIVTRIVSSGSSVYVAWEDARNNATYYVITSRDVYFNRSLDSGTSWMPSDVRLNTNPAGSSAAQEPRLATEGSSVFVTWQDDRNGHFDVYFNRSLDAGATWLVSDVRLNTDPPGASHSFEPDIATSGSSVYVAWQDRRGLYVGNIYFNYSSDLGTTWQNADLRIDRDPYYHCHDPRVAAAGSFVFVTWTDDPQARSNIYLNYSADGGATWQGADLQLNTPSPGTTYPARRPRIAAGDSSVYVIWEDRRNGTSGAGSDIYFNLPLGFQPYGSPTPGSGGLEPVLGTSGFPGAGSTTSVEVTQGLGGAPGAMFVGVGAASRIALPLLGGTVLVLPTLTVPLALGGAPGALGAGVGSLPLSIPASPSLVGTHLNFQGVILDAGAARGLSMTNGIGMWIG